MNEREGNAFVDRDSGGGVKDIQMAAECINHGGFLVRGPLPLAMVTQSLEAVFFQAPRCKISPPYLFFSPCATDHYLFWLILKSPQDRSCPDCAR